MLFTLENRQFYITVASDVSIRDGLGWELYEYVDEKRILLAELFRHDDLRKTSFATFEVIDIPFEALETLINDFNTTGGRYFLTGPDDTYPETM